VDGWVKVAFSCPSILSYHIISYRTWERRRLWLLGGGGGNVWHGGGGGGGGGGGCRLEPVG